jgi:hypothetical protein
VLQTWLIETLWLYFWRGDWLAETEIAVATKTAVIVPHGISPMTGRPS